MTRIVDEVFLTLAREDPDYLAHLKKLTSRVANVDVRDFREDVLYLDGKKAEKKQLHRNKFYSNSYLRLI